MGNMYDNGEYLKNNSTWHEEDSAWKAKNILGIINRNNIDYETICEVGCGAGEILIQLDTLLGSDKNYYGYEVSPDAFNICKNKSKKNIQFLYKNILEEEVNYDLVLAIDVFEHVEDYLGFLKKVKTKGEHKIFHIPLDLSVQTVLRSFPLLRAREKLGHLHYFSKETAIATLESSGYEIIDSCYTKGTIELPNRDWKKKFAAIPRNLMYKINADFAVRLLGGFSLLVLAK